MTSEIIETTVTWDHDLGTIRVDTRRKKVATRLNKIGMKKIPGLQEYWSFEGSDKEFGITFRRRSSSSAKKRRFGKNKAVLEPGGTQAS